MFVFRFAFVCVLNTEQGSHLCPDVCDARSPDNCRLWTMIYSLVISVPFSPKRHARLSTIQSIRFGRWTKSQIRPNLSKWSSFLLVYRTIYFFSSSLFSHFLGFCFALVFTEHPLSFFESLELFQRRRRVQVVETQSGRKTFPD